MRKSPLIRYDECPLMLPPQYFGSIAYYVHMSQFAHVRIANNLRYDKRFKSMHRCDIVDTQGRLSLTVPVSKEPIADGQPRLWRDVRVSSHGQWWHDHIVSLESAYGRTPFFEFYFDRFKPWLSDNHLPITKLNEALDREIRRILGLETVVEYVDNETPATFAPNKGESLTADTASIGDLVATPPYAELPPVEYYQVRKDKLGFVPGLSILDLIFNVGPEAPLILKSLQQD